jgi:hypothetical protein
MVICHLEAGQGVAPSRFSTAPHQQRFVENFGISRGWICIKYNKHCASLVQTENAVLHGSSGKAKAADAKQEARREKE